MRRNLRIALLIPAALLLGCGSSATPSNPAGTYLNLTGDWVVLATSNARPIPVADFTGALESSGGTVSGTMHAISLTFPQCVLFTQDLQVTGSIDANGNLALSIPIAGGTATINATVLTPETYSAGTWQITGGTCAMPSIPIQVAEFAPATGTYSGVLNVLDTTTNLPVPGTATTVNAALVQSTTPNTDGQFPLSGTITATGSCAGNFPIVNEVVSGGVFMPVPFGASNVELVGGIIPTATTLIADFSPTSACGSQTYSGTLTRQ